MKLTDILKETRRYKKAVRLNEEGFLKKAGQFIKKVADKAGFGGGETVDPSKLKTGEEYQLFHDDDKNVNAGRQRDTMIRFKTKWVATARYEGADKLGSHVFTVTFVNPKYSDGSTYSPKKGMKIEFDKDDVKKIEIVTTKDSQNS